MSDGTQNLDEMRHQHDLRNARLAKLEALHEALMHVRVKNRTVARGVQPGTK